MSIRIGILGYGNLGRGVECAIKHNSDLELVAVFTRRAPETVKILTETAAVYSVNDAEKMKDKVTIVKVDVDRSPDLAAKFGVMSVPTMIMFKNGRQVDAFSGYMPEANLMANIERNL